MKYAKFISFLGNLCYQQPSLLWTYLHGEKLFLVGGLPSLPCWILLSSLFYEEALLFVHWNSLFRLTSLLKDLDSLPFLIYMLFTESWQSPFFNLHFIYRILTVSLFPFTCYLQNLYWQSPLFDLHVINSLPFSICMLFTGYFTGSWQSPFFDLLVIYRILTVSLFQFTCYLQNLDSLPFSI